MLKDIIQGLRNGLKVHGLVVYARKELPGRFSGMKRAELFVEYGELEVRLMYLNIFYGKHLHLSSWVELFWNEYTVGVGGYEYIHKLEN